MSEEPQVVGTEDAGLDVPLETRQPDYQAVVGELESTDDQLVSAAEAFSKVWNACYDSVMYQTRDHEKATEAAEQAWLLFVEFLESVDGAKTSA